MKVAVIKHNDINYSESDKTHSRFKKEYLEEDIEDYVDFVPFLDSYDAMEKIIESCGFDKEQLINTTVIYESAKSIFYMIHIIDDKNENKNINKIAMYLTKNLFRITGSVGIMKEEILSNGCTNISNITFNELLDVYNDCLVHKCVIIDEKGSIDEVKYIFNPIDWLKVEESKNYKFIEYEIFDKMLMMFIEIQPANNILNEKATILYGKKIHGKVIFALRTKPVDIKEINFIYENLYKNTVEKLISVLSVQQDELKETDDEKKNMKVYNFYTVLEKRYLKYITKYSNGYLLDILNKIQNNISINEAAYKYILQNTTNENESKNINDSK